MSGGASQIWHCWVIFLLYFWHFCSLCMWALALDRVKMHEKSCQIYSYSILLGLIKNTSIVSLITYPFFYSNKKKFQNNSLHRTKCKKMFLSGNFCVGQFSGILSSGGYVISYTTTYVSVVWCQMELFQNELRGYHNSSPIQIWMCRVSENRVSSNYLCVGCIMLVVSETR